MDYPHDIVPSSRAYDPGSWPVKTYQAMDGAEVRLLYGSKRTGMKLRLSYENVSDQAAERFLQHYSDRKGTFLTFQLPAGAKAKAGWAGSDASLDVGATGNAWRYAEAPTVTNVRPGRSSVTVNLIGVF